MTTRRGVLATCFAGALVGVSRALAQPSEGSLDPAALRFRSIVVDATGVGRFGGAGSAETIRRQVDRDAHAIFADRLASSDKSAPQLLIRLDSLQLASFAGDSSMMSQGVSNTDYLEGAGLVMWGGRVLSTTPILSALDASYSGAWYLPDIDQRRIESIGHHFTSWLRREMGL